jgi:hypothetical protein
MLLNGTVYLVTDDPQAFPAMGSMASSPLNSNKPPKDGEWKIVSSEQAHKLGSFGSL